MDAPPGTVYLEQQGQHSPLRSPEPSLDPNEPLNWTAKRKTLHMILLSLYTLLVFASNTVSIPLWSDMSQDLDYSSLVLEASYAANAATLAIGCIIFIPFAIVIGRRIVYIVTALIVLACMIWSARTKTPGDVVGSGIVMGLAGSVNESLFQMTLVDLFFVHQRGKITGVYLVMLLIGNYLGPVVSGYIARDSGWRWSFWSTVIAMGVVTLALILGLEESKYVKPLAESAESEPANCGRVYSNDPFLTHNGDHATSESPGEAVAKVYPTKGYLQRHSLFGSFTPVATRSFLRLFYQPFITLFRFPAILIGAFQYGFYIAAVNILALTQSTLYARAPYHFTTVAIGNMNISPAIGAVLGSVFGGALIDRMILVFAKRNNGIYEPEMRLWLVLLPASMMSIGIFVYGLTIAQGKPWIINAVGAGFMGFGLSGAGDMLLTYVQDSYSKIIGTALVGAAFVANILTTIFLFAIDPWQASMGTYNMFVVLGCISIFFNLVNIPVIIWGKRWRRAFAPKYLRLARQQLEPSKNQ